MNIDKKGENNRLVEMGMLAIECMGVGVTIISPKGTLLYYNRTAAKILDRKPEFIGKDVHSHHKKAASNEKLDQMLQEFEKGRTAPFYYGARPYGKDIVVTLSPILKNGEFIGSVQSVMLKEDIVAES
jgi:sensor histidine kinase regulating citrate/malate metabolism